MNPYDKLLHTIFRITVLTLALVIITVVGVMCKALFDPQVNNTEIFAMLSPAFNTVIGAFVGLLGGISLTRPSKEDLFPKFGEDKVVAAAEPKAEESVQTEEASVDVIHEAEDTTETEAVAPKKAAKKKAI